MIKKKRILNFLRRPVTSDSRFSFAYSIIGKFLTLGKESKKGREKEGKRRKNKEKPKREK